MENVDHPIFSKCVDGGEYVFNQASAGIATLCLRHITKSITMQREYRYGELPARKDMEEDLHYKLQELGYTRVVNKTNEA